MTSVEAEKGSGLGQASRSCSLEAMLASAQAAIN